MHRILANKAIWKNSTKDQKVILVTLLMMANFEDNEWEWKGLKFTVKPGQFVTSLEGIREIAGKDISTQSVRTALDKLVKYEFLTNESTKTGRLITIINWKIYQGEINGTNIDDNNELTKHQQSGNKELTPIKEYKKERMIKNDKEVEEKNLTPSKKKEGVSDPNVKIFIDYFCTKFKERVNETYFFNRGKDNACAKSICNQIKDIEEIKRLCDLYFNTNDNFMLSQGFSISFFLSNLNKIMSGEKRHGYRGIRPDPEKEYPPDIIIDSDAGTITER